jgi:hypothetical protein
MSKVPAHVLLLVISTNNLCAGAEQSKWSSTPDGAAGANEV